jgi:beta-lactamase superfamily II metal-dependent hydrolase
MLSSTADTINTAFILQNGSSVVVVDGGFPQEAEHLHRVLRDLGGKVDAWFLTHPHDDHISALFTLLKQHRDIQVEKVYYNFPSDEFLCRHLVQQRYFTTQELLDTLRGTLKEWDIPTVTPETGDCYPFDGFQIRVLRTPDEAITYNAVNNASCVFRVEFPQKSILFLGDLGIEGGNQLMELYPDGLRADFVQMAHHGQNGVTKACYEAIRPTYCLWPTPSWLWENRGPAGYDTGIFNTVVTRGWISEMHCVKRHYRMTEAPHVIPLEEV